jgi:hypothetical protein
MRGKLRSLDDARNAYLNGKITDQELTAYFNKYTLVDKERKEIERRSKKIEKKLAMI